MNGASDLYHFRLVVQPTQLGLPFHAAHLAMPCSAFTLTIA